MSRTRSPSGFDPYRFPGPQHTRQLFSRAELEGLAVIMELAVFGAYSKGRHAMAKLLSDHLMGVRETIELMKTSERKNRQSHAPAATLES